MRNLLAAVNPDGSNQIQLTPGGGGSDSTFSNLSSIRVSGLVSGAITLALVVAAVIFFFMLVIGGIRWILSGGDKGQTEAARSQITAALIGLVIVFAAWAIATLIGNLIGLGNIFGGQLALPTFTGK